MSTGQEGSTGRIRDKPMHRLVVADIDNGNEHTQEGARLSGRPCPILFRGFYINGVAY
jgi:hypothetical protein